MTNQKSLTVAIIENGTESKVTAFPNENLLDLLHRYGAPVHTPCGGKHTCRKCLVAIKGEGNLLCCTYHVDHSIEVTLPETRTAQILHTAYEGAPKVSLEAGFTESRSGESITIRYNGIPLLTRPETHDGRRYGIAVDIGTTTVVLYLVDLVSGIQLDVSSFINPQTRHGHDVVSRIQYAMTQAEGLDTLRKLLIDRLNLEIGAFCNRRSLDNNDILKMSFAGNPTMLHLLCGVRPDTIAMAPYTPVFTEKKELRAEELSLAINPSAVVVVLPSVSGYVGADITAGLAATPLIDNEGMALFIDIGTNGEMALGNRDKLYCCATAAGPAFEGATIACGVGGVHGAISAYTDQGMTTIGNGAPVGICGSGLVDIVAALLDKGVIDPTGYLESDYELVPADKSAKGSAIVLTPQDVRQVQLAKAAVAAGIQVLLAESGTAIDSITALYIGGAFGNYMNSERAARIGLIPPALLDTVITVGNIAGKGALLSLMSTTFEKRVETIAAEAKYIELSTNMGFIEKYVEEMGFK